MAISLSAQIEVEFLKTLGNGEIENLEVMMANKINLNIDDAQMKIDKQKAILKINTFFENNRIIKYKLIHNGKSSDKNSSYRVARMTTPNGKYRVFVYSEKKLDQIKIVEIRINTM